jgi:Tol biopolymer transport system component
MNRSLISAALICTIMTPWLMAQPRFLRSELLPVEPSKRWTQPQFSADGASVFFTASDFGGIWQFNLSNRTMIQVTADQGAGGAFSLSPDGRQIVYRRTTQATAGKDRQQEIVLRDLVDRTNSILAAGSSLSVPIFADGKAVYTEAGKTRNLSLRKSTTNVTLLGIEDSKIALNKNGVKVLINPLGSGRYIWPALSPLKDKIVAYQMEQGAFVCDIEGKNVQKIGRRDSPSWTRDGKWIVYMQDNDDGHVVLTSDIWMIAPNGASNIQLTSTPNVSEMFPNCSPTENKIVCSTLDGRLYMITYTETAK